MKKINWGILAAGRISSWFCTGLQTVSNANILAIGSRSQEKAEQFGDRFEIEWRYGSYEELVNDPDIDVIYVGVPSRWHHEYTMLALRAGKNVVCEKPFSMNAKDTKEQITYAREHNLFLMEAMWTKCTPVYRTVMDWVGQGRIGEVRFFKADFFTPGKANPPHRLYNYEIGGGALLDLGVYPITYACSLLGHHPTEILSTADFAHTGVDINNSIILKYENGSYAAISSGFNVHQQNPAVIVGTKGKITIDHNFLCAESAQLRDLNNEIIQQVHYPFEKNGYEYEGMEATRCLQAGLKESPWIPLEHTQAVMEIMDTCRKQWGFAYTFEK